MAATDAGSNSLGALAIGEAEVQYVANKQRSGGTGAGDGTLKDRRSGGTRADCSQTACGGRVRWCPFKWLAELGSVRLPRRRSRVCGWGRVSGIARHTLGRGEY